MVSEEPELCLGAQTGVPMGLRAERDPPRLCQLRLTLTHAAATPPRCNSPTQMPWL